MVDQKPPFKPVPQKLPATKLPPPKPEPPKADPRNLPAVSHSNDPVNLPPGAKAPEAPKGKSGEPKKSWD